MTADLNAALDRIVASTAAARKRVVDAWPTYLDFNDLADNVEKLAAVVRAVLAAVEQIESDCAHHEAHESEPAEIRTERGWVNVDDYAKDIRTAITTAWEAQR